MDKKTRALGGPRDTHFGNDLRPCSRPNPGRGVDTIETEPRADPRLVQRTVEFSRALRDSLSRGRDNLRRSWDRGGLGRS